MNDDIKLKLGYCVYRPNYSNTISSPNSQIFCDELTLHETINFLLNTSDKDQCPYVQVKQIGIYIKNQSCSKEKQ